MRWRPRGRRVRVTLPRRPVTRTITPEQVEAYLRQTGWREVDDEYTPSPRAKVVSPPRDRKVPLSEVIKQVALHEGRSPGEVLRDIAAGKGLERRIRSTKRWPAWP